MAGTAVYNINRPTVAGDAGVWGGFLNTGMDTIDDIVARPKIVQVGPTYNVGGTTTLDLSLGRVFVFTVSGASTLAFSNIPSSTFAVAVRLLIVNGGAFTLTWPASILWSPFIGSPAAPNLHVAGNDIVDLWTRDAGVTWYGQLLRPTAGVLFQASNLSTTSASDVSLTSYVLPAGTLAANGQMLRISANWGLGGQTGSAYVKFVATN